MSQLAPCRILVIDDNPAIHDDFRKVLIPPERGDETQIAALEAALFGAAHRTVELPRFELDAAYQGAEGLQLVQAALREGRPYAMAFVDIRMPPGWDGIETIERIWAIYPELEVAICTAYTDYSWEEMIARLGHSDRLLILKKPFDNVEVRQLASCLSVKWAQGRRLRRQLDDLQRDAALAEAATRAKSEFIAHMSHEMRTPMNAILGFTEIALETTERAEQRECLETVLSAARALLGLIDQTLDLSKVEAGKLELACVPFALRQTAGEALRTLAGRAEEKQLALALVVSPAVPDALIGDPARLRQILLNLVGNAIKFTDRGGVVVRVAAEPTAPGAETVLHVAVSDTGIGIAAEALAVIFQPFVQADGSASRAADGTGLGLSIASRFVELMGGRIWAESALGAGSTFHFTARMRLAPAAEPPQAPLAAWSDRPVVPAEADTRDGLGRPSS